MTEWRPTSIQFGSRAFEQIRAACLEVQRDWTPAEEARRRGGRRLPAAISSVRMNVTSYRFAEVAEPRDI